MATESPDLERMIEEARQVARDNASPSWGIQVAGCVLALCGGMINAVAFLALGSHYFVSHLTGDTTHVGMRAAGFDDTPSAAQKKADAEEAASVYFAVLIIVAFLIGSCLSGMLIAKQAVNIGRSAYGVMLLMASALLVVGALSDITAGRPIGALCAAMACGVQNGMMTTYAGAIIRTTHVTGTWTDAGLSCGRIVQRLVTKGRNLSKVDRAYLQADFEKMRLMFALALSFCFGCYIGAELQQIHALRKKALLIPAAILASCGIGHALYVSFVLKIGFWRMLQISQQGPQQRQVLLFVDGEVHDLSASMIGGIDDLNSDSRPVEVSLNPQQVA